MSFVSTSQPAPGKRPGKQNRPYFGLRGSTVTPSASLRPGARPFSSQPPARAENRALGTAYMPKVAESLLLPAFRCFPPASPAFVPRAGKQKTAPKGRSKPLISLRKSGAGEGIRTLDPNLGKVASRSANENSATGFYVRQRRSSEDQRPMRRARPHATSAKRSKSNGSTQKVLRAARAPGLAGAPPAGATAADRG